MNRLLIWHHNGVVGNNTRIGPTYYIEDNFELVAVRIYSPDTHSEDCKVDIFDDGVSIFKDHSSSTYSAATGYTAGTADTSVSLYKNENGNELAEAFNNNFVEKGSWMHCNVVASGNCKDITVQLELRQISEDEIED